MTEKDRLLFNGLFTSDIRSTSSKIPTTSYRPKIGSPDWAITACRKPKVYDGLTTRIGTSDNDGC